MDVDASGGEQVLAWARITETTGAPLDAAAVELSLTPIGGSAHTWLTPDMSQQVSDSVVRAALLVDGRFTPDTYRLWARISDYPEVDFVLAAGARITVT